MYPKYGYNFNVLAYRLKFTGHRSRQIRKHICEDKNSIRVGSKMYAREPAVERKHTLMAAA
jgi:hypothetical protein